MAVALDASAYADMSLAMKNFWGYVATAHIWIGTITIFTSSKLPLSSTYVGYVIN